MKKLNIVKKKRMLISLNVLNASKKTKHSFMIF